MSARSAWCYTLNNPLQEESPDIWEDVVYGVYQRERCPATGVHHYQGYVLFATPKTFTEVKQLCYRAHWEPRFGTHQQASAYCQKEYSRIAGPWYHGGSVSEH